ncbi:transposase [Candidatus Poriferisodalis sp.]|uniref:transposase n=1 Tax=Candidatus Poriferisodalis sp. TaxID=3101277 RepID=UPI003B015B73
MAGRTRSPYPSEYKAELVRLVREEGRSPSELAREFEPSAQSIANWIAQAEIDDGKRGGLTTDEKAQLRRWRAENRVLRMEKDLLEKVAAFFAAKSVPTR